MNSEMNKFFEGIKNKKISEAWKGYGSAVFIELGELKANEERRNHLNGEYTLAFTWAWRFEFENTLIFGSSNSMSYIDKITVVQNNLGLT